MRSSAKRRSHQEGLSIIELMVAIAVLAIVMGAVAMTLGSSLTHSTNSAGRSVAASVAAEEMEKARIKARNDFAGFELVKRYDQTVGSVKYSIERDAQWVSANAESDACSDTTPSGTTDEPRAYLRVRVRVKWPGMGGRQPATSESLITPPIGAFDPSKGHVAVRVRGRDATGLGTVTVRLKQGGTEIKTLETTADGCAFFAYVEPGTYTVELDEPTYVDGQGFAKPTAEVPVTQSDIASTDFAYDRRTAIFLERVDATGAGAVIPTNVPLIIANPQLLPFKKRLYPAASTAPTQTVTDLFPYAAGYQAWTGSCDDADPEGEMLRDPADPTEGKVPRYPDMSRDPAIAVKPGFLSARPGTPPQPVGVRMAALPIRVTRKDDGEIEPVPNRQVRLVHAPDETCASGETLTYTATTDSNGEITIAAPLGRWTLEVIDESPRFSGWPVVQLSPPFDTVYARFNLRVQG